MPEYKALIVDDYQPMRKQLSRMLINIAEFKIIHEAVDGEDAWDKIIEFGNAYDLILLDLNMPKLNGMELLIRYRNNGNYENTPVIVVSGDSSDASVAYAIDCEADDYLIKPFSYEDLRIKVVKLLVSLNDPMEQSYREIEKLFKQKKFALALNKIQSCRFKTDTAKWIILKGKILTELKLIDEAEQCFNKLIGSDSILINAFKNYAKLQEEKNNLQAAIYALNKLEEISPLNIERKIVLGNMLIDQGQIAEAEIIFNKAIDLSSKNLEVREKIALIYEQNGFSNKAKKIIAESITQIKSSKKPIKRIDELCMKGIELREQEKIKEAEQHYLNALLIYPKSKELHYNIGALYIFMEQNKKACYHFNTALEIDPYFDKAKEIFEAICMNRTR